MIVVWCRQERIYFIKLELIKNAGTSNKIYKANMDIKKEQIIILEYTIMPSKKIYGKKWNLSKIPNTIIKKEIVAITEVNKTKRKQI